MPGQKLVHGDGEPLSNVGEYRRLVGRLLYLTATRLDLAYAMQQLSQFVDYPTDKHLIAAHRVLRYIKKDPGKGIQYPAQSNLQLQAFTDADWAACSETRKSITGFCVFLGGATVSWKAKKQQTISRSSSEAEYRRLAVGACEVQWLWYLLSDLGLHPSQPTTMYWSPHKGKNSKRHHSSHVCTLRKSGSRWIR